MRPIVRQSHAVHAFLCERGDYYNARQRLISSSTVEKLINEDPPLGFEFALENLIGFLKKEAAFIKQYKNTRFHLQDLSLDSEKDMQLLNLKALSALAEWRSQIGYKRGNGRWLELRSIMGNGKFKIFDSIELYNLLESLQNSKIARLIENITRTRKQMLGFIPDLQEEKRIGIERMCDNVKADSQGQLIRIQQNFHHAIK